MNAFEKFCISLRHNPMLKRAHWLWNGVRPVYDRIVNGLASQGLERNINGTDRILVHPRYRCIGEDYEPEVWKQVMAELRAGDTVADVGAFIGLYTVALARRVGPDGKVVGFEPDDQSVRHLGEHARLNGVMERVEVVAAAVGDFDGTVKFQVQSDLKSHVAVDDAGVVKDVRCVSLDKYFDGRRLDLLKVDVEGYEQKVIEGARRLLSDPVRGPRAIFIEVHPYAWAPLGATSEALLRILKDCGFDIFDMLGRRITGITTYGEVVARRQRPEKMAA
jgi:FkbM family methyltransferase